MNRQEFGSNWPLTDSNFSPHLPAGIKEDCENAQMVWPVFGRQSKWAFLEYKPRVVPLQENAFS
jgi:hypothetical protein